MDQSAEDDKPIALIGLVMIVKNEAHGLEATLRSFLPAIDCWTILDTGSTDGTQDLIRRCLSHLPGTLVEEPFVDFSSSRNRALELHGEASIFTVMPDSDDRLNGAENLRSFCVSRLQAPDRSYGITMQFGDLAFMRAIVHRTACRPKYVGRVHECLDVITHITIPKVTLTQEKPAESLEATQQRWRRDRTLLLEDVKDNPSNPRALFYLAQTYECLGEQNEAIFTYERRVALGGWREEVFMAKLRRARLLPDENMKRLALLDAHAYEPRRAEPLFTLAQSTYSRQEHGLTYLFASRADAMAIPEGLFVETDVYTWRAADLVSISAFYLSHALNDAHVFDVGRRAAEKALAACSGDPRVVQNHAFYTDESRPKSVSETSQ